MSIYEHRLYLNLLKLCYVGQLISGTGSQDWVFILKLAVCRFKHCEQHPWSNSLIWILHISARTVTDVFELWRYFSDKTNKQEKQSSPYRDLKVHLKVPRTACYSWSLLITYLLLVFCVWEGLLSVTLLLTGWRIQFSSPVRFLGGPGMLRRTSLASEDFLRMTPFSRSAVCIRRTLDWFLSEDKAAENGQTASRRFRSWCAIFRNMLRSTWRHWAGWGDRCSFTHKYSSFICSCGQPDQYEMWMDWRRFIGTSILTGSPTRCSMARRETHNYQHSTMNVFLLLGETYSELSIL